MAKKLRQVRGTTKDTRTSRATPATPTQSARPTYSSKGTSNYAQFAYTETEREIVRNVTQRESFAELVQEHSWEETTTKEAPAPRRSTRHFDVQAVQRELRASMELERSLNKLHHGRMGGATHSRSLSELTTHTSNLTASTPTHESHTTPIAQGQIWEFGDQVESKTDYDAAWDACEAEQEQQHQAELEQAFAAHEAELAENALQDSFATLLEQEARQASVPELAPLSQTRPTQGKKMKGYVFNKKQADAVVAEARATQESASASVAQGKQSRAANYNSSSSSATGVSSSAPSVAPRGEDVSRYAYHGKNAGDDFASLFASSSSKVTSKFAADSAHSSQSATSASKSSKTHTVAGSSVTAAQPASSSASSARSASMTDFERYFATGSYDKGDDYFDYRNSGKDELHPSRRGKGVPSYVAGASKKHNSLGADNLRTLARAEREVTTHKWRNESFEALYRAYDTTPSDDYQEQVARDGRGFAKVSASEFNASKTPSAGKKKRKFLSATPSAATAAKTTTNTATSSKSKIDWFDAEQVERYSERSGKATGYTYGASARVTTSVSSNDHERELSFAELFEADRTSSGKKVYVSAQMDSRVNEPITPETAATKKSGTPTPSSSAVTSAATQSSSRTQHNNAPQTSISKAAASAMARTSGTPVNSRELSDFERAWYAETAQGGAAPSNSVAAQLAQEARQVQHQQRQELGLMSRKEQLELELAREASLIKFEAGAQFISDINMRFDESNYMHANFFAEGYPAYIFEHLKQGNFNVDLEIDLHGCSRDDVKVIINKAIASAISHHESILYFMTGHGRDILKQALPNYLIQHSHVCAFVPRVDGTGQTNGFLALLKNFSKEFFNH